MVLSDFDQTRAALGNIDGPTLWRWVRDGTLPPPVLLDGLVRWSAPTLETWAALGCPPGPAVDYPTLNSFRRQWLRERVERQANAERVDEYLENMELKNANCSS